MILDLFIIFAGLSCILVFLGYYTKPAIRILAVLGFATLFFLGLLLQFNGVSQRSGDLHSLSYTNATLSSESVSYQYSVISDSTSKWIGRWLSIVSALSVALVFASNRESED